MKNSLRKILINILSLLLIISVLGVVACKNKNIENDNDLPVENFHLYSTAITLEIGQVFQLEFEKTFGTNLQFASENSDIVEISSTGLITGISAGTTVIKVSCNSKSENCKVTVIDSQVKLVLTYENINLVVGSSKNISAKVFEAGKEIETEITWSIDKAENTSIVLNGNDIIFTANAVGDYVLTATSGALVCNCNIRVITPDAVRLNTPVLTVNDCKTLNIVGSNNTKAYAISIDGTNWTETTDLKFDFFDYSEDLLYGEQLILLVKALAKDDYTLLDSYITEFNFSHEYESSYTTGKEATCIKAGEINYQCVNCDKQYKDSKYYAKHNFVSWQCTVCKEYRSTDVVYAYDDNYISIPTDEDATNENSEWRIKYYDYYKDQVTNFTSENLWETVEKNKDKIPVEQREACYYVNAIKDVSVKELYVAGYWYDEKCNPDPLPVKYVANSVFAYNKVIEKVVFSKEITEFRGLVFDNSRIKTVIAPGLTYLYDYQCEPYSFETRLNFQNCFSLETVVVGENFTSKGRQFYWFEHKSPWFEGYEAKINLYLDRYYDDFSNFTLNINHDGQLHTNDMFTGNYYFKDDTGNTCETWKYNDDGTDIIFNGHNFINGKCAKCSADDNKGIKYLYDTEQDCYYVGVARYNGRVKIEAQYNDGIHGKKDVKYIDEKAFFYNTKGSHSTGITHVYLPETITKIGSFGLCHNLEFVSMIGVEAVDVQNAFLDCVKLKTLVIGEKLVASRQCFYVRNDNPAVSVAVGYTSIMNVYSTAKAPTITFASSNDNMWSGKVYSFSENSNDCETWKWNNSGDSIVVTSDHNYIDNYCENCGQKDPKGLVYYYDTANDSYSLLSVSFVSGVIRIPETYDDGKHGEKAITSVSINAFKYNSKVTHVLLPDSVTNMPNFAVCKNLELLYMPGVTSVNQQDGFLNNAIDCPNLTTLIVGASFVSNGQIFYDRSGNDGRYMTIYTTATSNANISISGKNNNMWNGSVVYYSESTTKCNTWKWAEDGCSLRVTNDHNYVDGYCKNCGQKDSEGFTYSYDSVTDSYSLISVPIELEVVKVSGIYDDGAHGEKPVTSISINAFKYNSKVTHVLLPDSVTNMPNFAVCKNLELLYMPGVTSVNQQDGFLNNAIDCPKLTTLIVGPTFKSDGQVFYDRSGNDGRYMTVYTTATSNAEIEFTGTNNNMWNGKVVYYSSGAETCNTWGWANNSKTNIVLNNNEHNYDEKTGACSNCSDYKTYGLTYTLNQDGQSYYVSAFDGLVEIVRVYAEFNGKPVTSIGDEVFYSTVTWSGNATIKELYLPKTIERMPKVKLCKNLEVLSMPGVTNVTSSEKEFARDCGKLRTVIVGDAFTCIDQVFYNANTTNQDLTIYTTSTSDTTISIGSNNNDMWNGKIVYYSEGAEGCNTWCWKDDSHIGVTINKNQHSYDEETGICLNCNYFTTYGLTYTLNDDGNSYRVTSFDSSVSVLKVHAVYNNKPVTGVDYDVFKLNKVIKEVYLPKSIQSMPNFAVCSNLEILSMPGVSRVNKGEYGEGNYRTYENNTIDCKNLKILIVGENFTSNGQIFYDRINTGEYMSVYTTATSNANIIFTGTNNNMWNGKIVYFDANLSAENTWRWNDSGIGIDIRE